MEESDKTLFSKSLTHFSLIHRQPLTKEMRLAYWIDLCEMSLGDFRRADTQLRRNSQWFPKPCEFWAASRIGWS